MIQQILKSFLPILICFYMIDANGQFIENFEGTIPGGQLRQPRRAGEICDGRRTEPPWNSYNPMRYASIYC